MEALRGLFEKSLAEAEEELKRESAAPSAPDDPAEPKRPTPTSPNKADAQGNEHAEAGSANGGQFVSKDSAGTGAPPKDRTDKADESKLDHKFDGTPHKDATDFRKQASEVSPETIAAIVNCDKPSRIQPHVGLSVILARPVFKDRHGRNIQFLVEIVPKHESGYGRPMNEADIKRFAHVQNAIYAVKQDKGTKLKYKGRFIDDVADPPLGTQRLYQTPTDGDITWFFTYSPKGEPGG